MLLIDIIHYILPLWWEHKMLKFFAWKNEIGLGEPYAH